MSRKLRVPAGREHIPVHLGREEPIQKTAEFPAAWRRTSGELLAALPPAAAVSQWEELGVRIRADGTTEETAAGGTRALVASHANGARFHRLFLSAVR